MLLHPLFGLPHVYKDDYGTEGITFKALFPLKAENPLDASSTLFCLLWGQDMEMKLPFPSGFLTGGTDDIFSHDSVRHTSQRRIRLHAVEIS